VKVGQPLPTSGFFRFLQDNLGFLHLDFAAEQRGSIEEVKVAIEAKVLAIQKQKAARTPTDAATALASLRAQGIVTAAEAEAFADSLPGPPPSTSAASSGSDDTSPQAQVPEPEPPRQIELQPPRLTPLLSEKQLTPAGGAVGGFVLGVIVCIFAAGSLQVSADPTAARSEVNFILFLFVLVTIGATILGFAVANSQKQVELAQRVEFTFACPYCQEQTSAAVLSTATEFAKNVRCLTCASCDRRSSIRWVSARDAG
jgi:hypothetical protein